MNASAALNNIERVDLEDIAPRETPGDCGPRGLVVDIVEGRHDDPAVRNVQIHVAALEWTATPIFARPARLDDFHDLESSPVGIPRCAQPANGLDRRLEIRVRTLGWHADDNSSWSGETRNVVDMAIGLFVGKPRAEPNDLADSRKERQSLFDLLPAQMRVPVFVE